MDLFNYDLKYLNDDSNVLIGEDLCLGANAAATSNYYDFDELLNDTLYSNFDKAEIEPEICRKKITKLHGATTPKRKGVAVVRRMRGAMKVVQMKKKNNTINNLPSITDNDKFASLYEQTSIETSADGNFQNLSDHSDDSNIFKEAARSFTQQCSDSMTLVHVASAVETLSRYQPLRQKRRRDTIMYRIKSPNTKDKRSPPPATKIPSIHLNRPVPRAIINRKYH